MNKNNFIQYLTTGDFTTLFIELGWDHPDKYKPLYVDYDDKEWALNEIVQKSGFRIYICHTEGVPLPGVRRCLDAQLRRYGHDYLVVFVHPQKPLHHLWLIPVKTVEKRELVAIEYQTAEQAEFLHEKLLAISFGLQEDTSIIDVVAKVNASFTVNATKITKDFYTTFRKHHDAFAKFIEGIPVTAKEERHWYASVMLNRLMFCYFIQKKGFLDLNYHYLKQKLDETVKHQGRDKFYGTFYKRFLKVLFREGLNAPTHNAEFEQTFGRIPYLNGGLFEDHELESKYPELDIKDQAFHDLFDFFDKWHWHLDYNITASGRDINPDVLGYIFEQYINDRAQMGAYYTKEDITEYIAKNTIIPFLFDKVMETSSAKHLKPGGTVWQDLKKSGDEFIYAAVKRGTNLPLPENIVIGLTDEQLLRETSRFTTSLEGVALSTPHHLPHSLAHGGKGLPPSCDSSEASATLTTDDVTPVSPLRERRKYWNNPTDPQYALPTEIWRETVTRRQRYFELKQKIAAGEINSINDFITFNLDIRGFVSKMLGEPDLYDHLLVRHFYEALQDITILDPTCGSGAFLFAALNVLEPLYEICLERMIGFNQENPNLFKDELSEFRGKYKGNIQHYIYKTIILRNLYGVDIMHEATEIAKLRLFLKTVAAVDVDRRAPNLGLDPLPDIDFNIRCGNTLVGFANMDDILTHYQNSSDALFAFQQRDKIAEQCEMVSKAYNHFKTVQLRQSEDYQTFITAKADLSDRLTDLRNKLDALSNNFKNTTPFHWIAEFYGIIGERGGFDVIIGNPPYVEHRKIDYSLQQYKTQKCGNLYAPVIERALSISRVRTRTGMIIQNSAFCTPRMLTFKDIFVASSKTAWVSTFDDRPGKLFDLEHIRVAICLNEVGSPQALYTSNYIKFAAEFREYVFKALLYEKNVSESNKVLAKRNTLIDASILTKLKTNQPLVISQSRAGQHKIYYHNAPQYFIRAMAKPPYFWNERDGEKVSIQVKTIPFSSNHDAAITGAALNSSLFYWWFIVFSDCRDLTNREIDSFPLTLANIKGNGLVHLFKKLCSDYERHKFRKECQYKATGKVIYDEYYPKLSKPIIDEIDTVLAEHYGFTEEELDYIINYDIKYRMGGELGVK